MKEIFDDLKNTIWQDERILEHGQLAQEFGFRFRTRARFAEQPYALKGMQLFTGSKGKRLNGILSKDLEWGAAKARIYDYLYYGDTKTKTTTVFEFNLPQVEFSPFLIQPKTNGAKIRSFFSRTKPLFRNSKEFNRKYELITPFPERVQLEINEAFLSMLPDLGRVRVEGEKNFLIFYYKKYAPPTRELMDYYEVMLDLVDALLHGYPEERYV